LVALAGCGGGGGGGNKTTTAAQPVPSTTTSSTAAQSGSTTLSASTVTTTSTSKSTAEQQSGDETPISTQALFTGRGGRITPGRIRVPPFIAVTVVLQSADGRTYAIEVNGHGMATNGRARLKLSGLRAGDRYVVTNKSGTPARLIIEASAEPGP
jgi:hypothetical protein